MQKNIEFDLQAFASPIAGAKIIYLFREYSKRTTDDAKIIAFQTEGTETISKDADVTNTKSGPIRTPKDAEIEISVTAILEKGDSILKALRKASRTGALIECWKVNLEEKGTADNANKYEATYYQGYLTNVEESAEAEDFVEVSMDFGANGTGEDGYVTLSQEQEEATQYSFQDVTKTGAAA